MVRAMNALRRILLSAVGATLPAALAPSVGAASAGPLTELAEMLAAKGPELAETYGF